MCEILCFLQLYTVSYFTDIFRSFMISDATFDYDMLMRKIKFVNFFQPVIDFLKNKNDYTSVNLFIYNFALQLFSFCSMTPFASRLLDLVTVWYWVLFCVKNSRYFRLYIMVFNFGESLFL